MEILGNEQIPWTVLGRGSNTLAPSEGWEGVAVILGKGLSGYTFNGEVLSAGGGAPLPSMAGAACSRGLSGLVFAVGIPGTTGGAVYMNAGAYGSSIADVVQKITVMNTDGELITLPPDKCFFGYRSSIFQNRRWVIIGITLKLFHGEEFPGKLREEAVRLLRLRRSSFPLQTANAGSVFKRPAGDSPPGKLIEECGLKGVSIGGAKVSRIHANFIENTGGATSDDVISLMDLIAGKVMHATGIMLEREIRIIGGKN
jgi:UDP-N-acetylmuramate dehydrogenase